MTARWYVIQVYSGFEQKISDSIQEQAVKKGFADDIEEIMVPTQEVVELKRGQRVTNTKQIFPGYILIKMEMSDAAWHLIKDTDKVTGFLGGGRKPVPISQKEAEAMMNRLDEDVNNPAVTILFDIGEEVRVTDGPFASFNGIVEQIDEDKQKLKVSVSIFGRATPVELDYGQVEKE